MQQRSVWDWLFKRQPLEIRIAEGVLDSFIRKGQEIERNLYQVRMEPVQSPHCFLHEGGPVPLHRTSIDTYMCLFCRAERMERPHVPHIRTQEVAIPPHLQEQQRRAGQ